MNKPSYTIGYWRPWNKDSNFVESWLDYNRDNQRSQYGANLVLNGLKELGEKQYRNLQQLDATLKSVDSTLKTVDSTLKTGFNAVFNSLKNINTTLHEGFNIIAENQKRQIQISAAGNILLANIQELLQIPDSEKERLMSLKEGLRFISNVNKNEEFYEDALKNFSKAFAIKEQDYFTLYNLGMIHLYSEKHCKIELSLKYFKDAYKYASIDSNTAEMIMMNKYYGEVIKDNKSFLVSLILLISKCHYLLGNDENAYSSLTLPEGKGNKEIIYSKIKYASRLSDPLKIKDSINDLIKLNLNIDNNLLNDLDVIYNEYTIESLLDYIISLNENLKDLQERYKEKDYAILNDLRSDIKAVGEHDLYNKRRILKFYSEERITQTIESEDIFNKEISQNIEQLYTKMKSLENDYNFHSLNSETESVLREEIRNLEEKIRKLEDNSGAGRTLKLFLGIGVSKSDIESLNNDLKKLKTNLQQAEKSIKEIKLLKKELSNIKGMITNLNKQKFNYSRFNQSNP